MFSKLFTEQIEVLSYIVRANFFKELTRNEWKVVIHPTESIYHFGKIGDLEKTFSIEIKDNEIIYIGSLSKKNESIVENIINEFILLIKDTDIELFIADSNNKEKLYPVGEKAANIQKILDVLKVDNEISTSYINLCKCKTQLLFEEMTFDFEKGTITLWKEEPIEFFSPCEAKFYLENKEQFSYQFI